MLAFNLGIFFRNLKGGEVRFSAKNNQCEMNFSGGVIQLLERTDLDSRLSVTLGRDELTLSLVFDDDEEPEVLEDIEVEVHLHDMGSEGPPLRRKTLLAHNTFRFGEISLKPAAEEEVEDPPSQDTT